jgi:hypothetical protein
MRAFIVELENRPGSLAELCEAIGAEGINISGLSGASRGQSGAVAFITNLDSAMRQLLVRMEADYRECDVIAVGLDDRPGVLGGAARRLAEHGVNVEAIIPTGVQGMRITVTLAVDDAEKARQALGDLTQRVTSSI